MRITLFVPCFVDLIHPQIAVSMVQILERLGHTVECPQELACCGQPAFNSGYWDESRAIAVNVLSRLRDAEAVVVASLALLLALALGRIVTSMLAFCCMYLFARVGYLMVLLGVNTGATEGSLFERFDARYVELAGYLLPRMDRFADTGWLTGSPVHFGPDILQALIYIALLGAVANLELRRKQF